MSKCRWNIKSGVTDKAKKLSKEIGLTPVVTQVLINRGFSSKENIESFFNPNLANLANPSGLSDMDKAAQRLADAVEKKEKICIYGDYDIDGSTAVVTMVSFLRELGSDVIYYQPERFGEGYGLSVEPVKKLYEKGVQLLVSVDCCTSNIETAKYCKSVGMDLVITDHHKIGNELPDAYAFVNPHKKGEDPVYICLAGVGVAYYLVIATRKVLREKNYFNNTDLTEPDLKNYLDVVAFGTVADVVPIVGLNRILVKRGMELINLTPRMGIRALKEVSGVKNKINSEVISYILSPRLNAAGRMGNASRSVELLMATDEVIAKELANVLHEENQKRVSFQNKSWLQVQTMIEEMILNKSSTYFENKFSLTLASEGWHQGVIGIIASKAVERWYKPTAVYSIGEHGLAKGSARSIHGVDIYNIFSGFREIFEDFGGHDMASGMSIKTDRIPKFEELFEQGVSKYINAQKIQPALDIDVEVDTGEIGVKAANEISSMEPFGIDNPAPLFLCTDVKVFSKTVLKEKHLKLKLEKNIDAIGFNMGELHDLIGDTVNIVFRPNINEWNGLKQLQYVIVDLD